MEHNLENNLIMTQSKPNKPNKNNIKYKRMLLNLSQSNFIINDIYVGNGTDMGNGVISFSIPLKDIGFTVDDCLGTFNKELFSTHIVNFIGELYIRNNKRMFIEYVVKLNESIDPQTLIKMTSTIKHTHFGVTLSAEKQCLIFSFYLNLLNKILTEHFQNN